jgi:hypothetical protein
MRVTHDGQDCVRLVGARERHVGVVGVRGRKEGLGLAELRGGEGRQPRHDRAPCVAGREINSRTESEERHVDAGARNAGDWRSIT